MNIIGKETTTISLTRTDFSILIKNYIIIGWEKSGRTLFTRFDFPQSQMHKSQIKRQA